MQQRNTFDIQEIPKEIQQLDWWIVAAGAAGVAMLLPLVVYGCYRVCCKKKKKIVVVEDNKIIDNGTPTPSASTDIELEAEIMIVNQSHDEISSLGEEHSLYYNLSGRHLGGQQQQQSFRSKVKEVERSSSSIQEDPEEEGEETSVVPEERIIEIEVPPGKLGMVIDAPDMERPPVVHALKPESVLQDFVRVGDTLLEVNGMDVSLYTTMEVSRLLSSTSSEPRILKFARKGAGEEV